MWLYEALMKTLKAMLQLDRRSIIATSIAIDMAQFMTAVQLRETIEVFEHTAKEKERAQ